MASGPPGLVGEDLKNIEELLDKQQQAPAAEKEGAKEGKKKKEDRKPEGIVEKPKLSKAERRALQEEQIAKKAAAAGKPAPLPTSKAPPPGQAAAATSQNDASGGAASAAVKSGQPTGMRVQYDDPKAVAKLKRNQQVSRTEAQKKVPWFTHLPQYERESTLSEQLSQRKDNDIHPEVLKLGLKFADWLIVGGNARTVAMLKAFMCVVRDYTPTADKDVSNGLDAALKPMITYLVACRPLSIGMGNAVRWLKAKIAELRDPKQSFMSQTPQENKNHICEQIEAYITEKVIFADRIIAKHAASKLKDGDVILVYARSMAVEQALKKAHRDGTKFKVIVVDSRPKLEGKAFLQTLDECGMSCTYILISALSYVMPEVTKVLIGASALLSNGGVISRAGTASVAMMAKQFNVPVLVCCETYKFSEKVMLDSICSNELADPDEIQTPELADWRDVKDMKLLNLTYDLTPVDFVTLVITELGHLPPTSVPVVIREYRKEVTL